MKRWEDSRYFDDQSYKAKYRRPLSSSYLSYGRTRQFSNFTKEEKRRQAAKLAFLLKLYVAKISTQLDLLYQIDRAKRYSFSRAPQSMSLYHVSPYDGASEYFVTDRGYAPTLTTGFLSFVGDIADSVVEGVKSATKVVASTAKSVATGVVKTVNKVTTGVGKVVKNVGHAVESAATGVVKGVKDVSKGVAKVVDHVANVVVDAEISVLKGVGNVVEHVADAVEDVATGVVKEVGNVVDDVADAVGDMATGVVRGVEHILGGIVEDPTLTLEARLGDTKGSDVNSLNNDARKRSMGNKETETNGINKTNTSNAESNTIQNQHADQQYNQEMLAKLLYVLKENKSNYISETGSSNINSNLIQTHSVHQQYDQKLLAKLLYALLTSQKPNLQPPLGSQTFTKSAYLPYQLTLTPLPPKIAPLIQSHPVVSNPSYYHYNNTIPSSLMPMAQKPLKGYFQPYKQWQNNDNRLQYPNKQQAIPSYQSQSPYFNNTLQPAIDFSHTRMPYSDQFVPTNNWKLPHANLSSPYYQNANFSSYSMPVGQTSGQPYSQSYLITSSPIQTTLNKTQNLYQQQSPPQQHYTLASSPQITRSRKNEVFDKKQSTPQQCYISSSPPYLNRSKTYNNYNQEQSTPQKRHVSASSPYLTRSKTYKHFNQEQSTPQQRYISAPSPLLNRSKTYKSFNRNLPSPQQRHISASSLYATRSRTYKNFYQEQPTQQQRLSPAPSPYLTRSKTYKDFNKEQYPLQLTNTSHDWRTNKRLSRAGECYDDIRKSLEEINYSLKNILNKIG